MISAAEQTALVEALRSRDRATRERAAEQLFEAMQAPLFQVALRVSGQLVAAEDAVGETFVEVLRSIHAFRGEAKLSTWMFRVAIRAALRQKRGRGHPAGVLPEELLAPEDLPDAALAEREGAARLLAAIAKLPPKLRAVVGLAALEELPQTEIAEVLGIPVGTVHSRLSAARARLRAELRRRTVSDTFLR